MTDASTPQSICLLRTSALGDVTHVVPLVHTLRAAFPAARLTWIVGKLEHKLVGDLPGVEFVVFDKSQGLEGMRNVRLALEVRRFDALLHMQVALRANLLSLNVRARRRIGYDAARSKDLHGLTINERIAAREGQHVLDAIGSFAEPLGVKPAPVRWDIPIPIEADAWAADQLSGDAPWLLINAASSHVLRNWHAAGYAAVADHAQQSLGWRVALTGGPSRIERQLGDAVRTHMRTAAVDLIGRDTLKRALALYRRATAVLTPDAGPMHMANAVGTPVLGLHAASNPARSGPYSDRRWCVDRYAAAAHKFLGRAVEDIAWGTKIERPGVMQLIRVEDVIERLEALDLERRHGGLSRHTAI